MAKPLKALPKELRKANLALSENGLSLTYTFDSNEDRTGIATLLKSLGDLGIFYNDLHTSQSSLEDIFVNLVKAA